MDNEKNNKDEKFYTGPEKRRYIRHPICYPLEYENAKEKTKTLNISIGGLLFESKHKAEVGKTIILKLPLMDRVFKVKAAVKHVEKNSDTNLFNIGVEFVSYRDAYKTKLIEQIYLIDEYRALKSLQTGKEVSLKDASEEWIKKYSERFKKLYW